MEQFSLKVSEKEKSLREDFIKSESPEQPFIHIQENKEAANYEAVFALELEGVLQNSERRETTEREDQDTGAERFKNSLKSVLSINHRLDFVYTGGKNANEHEYFDWKIIGRSGGSTADSAIHGVQQLRQSLGVALGDTERDYRFTLVPANDFEDASTEKARIYSIQPSGISINVNRSRKIGFRSGNVFNNQSCAVIIPYEAENRINNFDSVVIGAPKCPAPVNVVLSINPFTLSSEELQRVASVLEWFQNGEPKRIKYNPTTAEGIEDPKVLNGIKRNLMNWLKNPSGFRITCSVASEKSIPSSFLSIVGNEVFSGSRFIVKNGITSDKDSETGILDLRSCFNEFSAIPPLFPRVSTLIDCGIKKAYNKYLPTLSETGICIGKANNKAVLFARPDRSRHCYIVGATGTGKSTLLYNMIIQDIKNGEGVVVIDPHGDLYKQVLISVPKRRTKDVVLIDPCDFDYTVGINFLECNDFYRPVQMNFIVNEMIKIFDRLYDLRQTGGPLFEQYMRNALLLIMDDEFGGATLMDLPTVFEDSEYRRFLKDKCKDPFVESFWTKQAEEAGGDASLRNIAPYITSKLNQFTTNALLRPIIGQSKSTINFRDAIDEGKIILVNLSKGLLGELDTQLLGMLIIGKIFSSAMGRVSLSPEKRRPVFLYVDEFQNFTTDTIAHLLSEARKFGICLTLANQNLSQLLTNSGRQNILDAVLGNVGTILSFRLGAMDAEKMQSYTKPEIQAQDLQELPDFHASGRLLNKNTPSKPFVFKTLPAENGADCIDTDFVIEASRWRYSTLIKQVEADILKRKTACKKKCGIFDEELIEK